MAFDNFTADDLLKRLRLYDFSRGVKINVSDEDLLLIADDIIRSKIAAFLITMVENFYTVKGDFNFVVGQTEYVLPKDAMFNMIQYISYVNADGFEDDIELVPVSRTWVRNLEAPGTPTKAYLTHQSVNFFPPPASASDKYRLYYYRRPAFLVKKEKAGFVTNVNKVTGVVTYAALPATGFTATSSHDFYSQNPPFYRLKQNITATVQAGLTQTFPIADVQTLNSGDAVTVTGQTIVPDIPPELFLLLMEVMRSKIASANGDTTKKQMTDTEIQESIKLTYQVPGNRVTEKTKSLDLTRSPLYWGY